MTGPGDGKGPGFLKREGEVFNETEQFVPFNTHLVQVTDSAGNVQEIEGANAKKKELKRQLRELEKQQKLINKNESNTTEDVKSTLADKIADLRFQLGMEPGFAEPV
jgi:hypothetical protein